MKITLISLFSSALLFFSTSLLASEPQGGNSMDQIVKDAFNELESEGFYDNASDADLAKIKTLTNQLMANAMRQDLDLYGDSAQYAAWSWPSWGKTKDASKELLETLATKFREIFGVASEKFNKLKAGAKQVFPILQNNITDEMGKVFTDLSSEDKKVREAGRKRAKELVKQTAQLVGFIVTVAALL